MNSASNAVMVISAAAESAVLAYRHQKQMNRLWLKVEGVLLQNQIHPLVDRALVAPHA